MILVLCPFLLSFCFAQETFNKNHENPYTKGKEIAREFGPEAAHDYYETCHSETGDLMCFFGVAGAKFLLGQNEAALKLINYLLANEPVPNRLAGHCHALKGSIYIHLRLFEEAQISLKEALRFYELENHDTNIFRCLVQLGNASMRAGDVIAADHYFRKAILQGTESNVNMGHLHTLMAISAYSQGHLNSAVKLSELAYEEHQRHKFPKAMVNAKAYISFFLCELGDVENAKELLKSADLIRKNSNLSVPPWTELVEAYVNKREKRDYVNKLFSDKLQGESDFFLRQFLKKALEKTCD